KVCKPDDPALGLPLVFIGSFAANRRLYAYSEDCFKRGIAILEKADADHKLIPSALGSLAVVYENQRRFSEAESSYKRAIALAEKLNNTKAYLEASKNLASMYSTQRRYSEANAVSSKSRQFASKGKQFSNEGLMMPPAIKK